MGDTGMPSLEATERIPLERPPRHRLHYWKSRPSGGIYKKGCPLVVTSAPCLIKTPRMPYWHRPRYAMVVPSPFGLLITRWCGNGDVRSVDQRGVPLLTADRVPLGEVLCRACEINAVVAGQPCTPIDPYLIVPLRLVAS